MSFTQAQDTLGQLDLPAPAETNQNQALWGLLFRLSAAGGDTGMCRRPQVRHREAARREGNSGIPGTGTGEGREVKPRKWHQEPGAPSPQSTMSSSRAKPLGLRLRGKANVEDRKATEDCHLTHPLGSPRG